MGLTNADNKYIMEAYKGNNSTKESKMDKFTDAIIIGGCILTIVAGSILGAFLLIQTL